MKEHRYKDALRHLSKRTNASRWIESLAVENDERLGSGSITFAPSVTTIVGSNGTGKTSLLRLIAVAAGAVSPTNPSVAVELGRSTEGSATLKAHVRGSVVEVTWKNGMPMPDLRPEEDPWVYFIHPAVDTLRQVAQIETDAAFSDLIEQVEPQQLADTDREVLAWLTGKKYSEVRVFELEAAHHERLPFFLVHDGVGQYGSTEMGSGELAAMYLFWAVRQAPKNSVLLIEEPEAFLAPITQEHVFWFLAEWADKTNSTLIMNTHSESFVLDLEPTQVRVLARRQTRTTSQLAIGWSGGTPPFMFRYPKKFSPQPIFVVEDRVAACLLGAILRARLPEYARSEVHPVGSHSEVRALVSGPMKSVRTVITIGVLDGDQRGSKENSGEEVILPGTVAPDRTLQDYVCTSVGLESFATLIGRSPGDIAGIVESLAYTDPHDFFPTLATGIGLDLARILDSIARAWVSDPRHTDLMDEVQKRLLDRLQAHEHEAKG